MIKEVVNMKRKPFAWSLSILLALAAFGGCAPAKEPAPEPVTFTEEELSRETKLIPNPDLTGDLYFRSYCVTEVEDPQYCRYAILELYRKYYPNVNLKAEFIDSRAVSNPAYQTLMATELMAGTGPDLIWLDSLDSAGGGIDNDPPVNAYKMMQAGAFLDLTDYFRNDPTYNPSDFNQVVMQTGKYKGAQYLVPLTYQFSSLITTRENAEAVGFHPEKCTDLKAMCEELRSVLNENRLDVPEKSIIFNLYTPFLVPSGLGTPWVDYERQEIHLDTPEMKEYCTFIKDEFASRCVTAPSVILGSKFYYTLESQATPIVDYIYGSPDTLFEYNFIFMNALGTDDIVIVPWRTLDGGIEASVTAAIGVRSNTKNPDAAYQFIRAYISQEYYSDPSIIFGRIYPSVNKIAMQEYMDYVMQPTNIYMGYTGTEIDSDLIQHSEGVSQEIVDQYMEILDSITSCRITTPIETSVRNGLQDYFNGNRSYESCISELQSTLEIYMTE